MRKLLILVVSLISCLSMNAATNMIIKQKDGSTVILDTKKISRVICEKITEEDLLVPDTSELLLKFNILPDNMSVEVRGSNSECKNLKTIEIPEKVRIDGRVYNVTTIDSRGFNYNTNLQSIIIPEGITTIENNAFIGCEKLENLSIPHSVTTIDYEAFNGCTSLKTMIIPKNIKMGSSVFKDCTGLTSVTFEEGVTEIAFKEFINCTSLEKVEIPSSVTKINSSAFEGCENLSIFDIPDNITEIGGNAFSGCNKFTPGLLIYANGTKCYGWIGDKSLCENIVIPDGVTIIGENAFDKCSNLTSIVIPESVTNIEYSAFYLCTSLTDVNIPEAITAIENATFYECKSLTSMKLSSKITSIGANAFNGCTNLDLEIDNSESNVDLGFLALLDVKSVTWLK